MSFQEIEFPRSIGFHIVGGPSFLTTVNQALSGMEQRNQNWLSARSKWTLNLTTPSQTQLSAFGTQQTFCDIVHTFFLNMGGKANSFRFYDPIDNSFFNQIIGVGNGVKTQFQLVKTYTIGVNTYLRTITKPITQSVINYLGVTLGDSITISDTFGPVSPTLYSVNYTNGIVTFNTPVGDGEVIFASGYYDYPVRFDVDAFPVQIEESDVGGGEPLITIKSLPIIEVLPPNY